MTQVPSLVLLDASCLLNLYSTGRFKEIALALPYQLAVTDYVLEQEALYVWLPGQGQTREERESIDLSPLVSEGIIGIFRLEYEEEEATFVDLAALIDDGEAMTGVLPLHRGCAVATDDRKARRVLSERAPSVPLISTLEMVKQWAEPASAPEVEVRTVLLAMRTGASYIPGERDPLYQWWRGIVFGREGHVPSSGVTASPLAV